MRAVVTCRPCAQHSSPETGRARCSLACFLHPACTPHRCRHPPLAVRRNDLESDGAAGFYASADFLPEQMNPDWVFWWEKDSEWRAVDLLITCQVRPRSCVGSAVLTSVQRSAGPQNGRQAPPHVRFLLSVRRPTLRDRTASRISARRLRHLASLGACVRRRWLRSRRRRCGGAPSGRAVSVYDIASEGRSLSRSKLVDRVGEANWRA